MKQTNSVEEMNKEAANKLDDLHNILAKTLDVNDAVDWEIIKRKEYFKIKPEQYCESSVISIIQFLDFGRPEKVKKVEIPSQPKFKEFKNAFNLISRIFKKQYIEEQFNRKTEEWKREVEKAKEQNLERERIFKETSII